MLESEWNMSSFPCVTQAVIYHEPRNFTKSNMPADGETGCLSCYIILQRISFKSSCREAMSLHCGHLNRLLSGSLSRTPKKLLGVNFCFPFL